MVRSTPGNNETEAFVRTVYALRFDRVTMSGGGIQYQQYGANCGGIGWWDFYTVALVRKRLYCELHNNRPRTAETSAIRVS